MLHSICEIGQYSRFSGFEIFFNIKKSVSLLNLEVNLKGYEIAFENDTDNGSVGTTESF